MSFLPTNKKEMQDNGWEQADFVLVTGDAYVDHPSFGHAIIARILESHGYKVAILAQPNWKNADDFKNFGRPKLGFLITAGNVDSMVNHYSVFKKRRKTDIYSPGGVAGMRPDRATIVYASRAREAYKDVAIVVGGLEASLRRFAHYDYWDDKVRKSILLDAKADILVYGMAENTIVEIADALNTGMNPRDITWIRGTSYRRNVAKEENINDYEIDEFQMLPSFEQVSIDKTEYAKSFATQYKNSDPFTSKKLIEPYEGGIFVVQNPPAQLLSSESLDRVYDLPYEGTYYDGYEHEGGIPAIEEVKFSITANRGCFGSCAFCALTFHQGRIVQGRGKESILAEAERMTKRSDFKGYIHDVGGPTANFRGPACEKQGIHGTCKDKDCLYPEGCKNMKVDHTEYLDILRSLRKIPKVKKVFIRSGIRFDYAIYDKDDTFIKELCQHHVSGTLKVAPEHISEEVLKRMRKPSNVIFQKFKNKYNNINKELGLNQFIIPYFISSHPGSTLKDGIILAEYLKKEKFLPDQVQDFYPTPSTLSTCMYYTGLDPLTMEEVYVTRDMEEKKMQRALLHFHKPENYDLVKKALMRENRQDLIGFDQRCLIKPKGKKDDTANQTRGHSKAKQSRISKDKRP